MEEYTNVEVLETESNLKWMEIIENELQIAFDTDGPLWRLKIVKLMKNLDQN